MKRLKKSYFVLFAVFALVLMMQMNAGAYWNTVTPTFTCTSDSVTVNWTKPVYQSPSYGYSYAVAGYYLKHSNGNPVTSRISANSTSYTFSGVGSDLVDNVRLWVVYYETDPSGNRTLKEAGLGSTYLNTLPGKISNYVVGTTGTSSIGVQTELPGSKTTGTQLELTDLVSGKKVTKTFSTYGSFAITNDRCYKARVRAYYKNTTNKKTYYGPWTSYKVFDVCSMAGQAKSTKKGFSLTLKRATGVAKYLVYISRSQKTGYKKSGTVTVTGTKKTVQVTKMGSTKLKKNVKYYVRVIPVLKINGKTVNSAIYTSGAIKVLKSA